MEINISHVCVIQFFFLGIELNCCKEGKINVLSPILSAYYVCHCLGSVAILSMY